MLQRFAYRYHRFLGIMFITFVGTGLIKIDFSKTQINQSETSSMTQKDGKLSLLKKANAWLNSPPLTAPDLRGKVVLIEFGTYTCINWIRTLPYVRAWIEKYKDKGLVVIGVHTPEFPFEKNIDNIRRSINDMQIDFPIAIDNNYAIWKGFNNHYWPAFYFIDTKGNTRHHQFGEGAYEQSERMIQQLLTEAGAKDIDHDPVSTNASGSEAAADWSNLQSPETYLGYERIENLANDNPVYGNQHVYSRPSHLQLNQWGVSGNWALENKHIILKKASGKIIYRFHARRSEEHTSE